MYVKKCILLIKRILICTLFLPMTGCWSAISIQDQLYISAMGIEYEDEKFTIYAQMFDFNSLSRSEGGARNSPEESTFIGKGQGKTMNQAVFNLYQTSQEHVEWGHMGVVVVSAKAMEQLGSTIVERLYRSPSTRYNTWLYVTEEPIEKILATSSFFNMTSLFTILHNPTGNYEQNSIFPPTLMFKYIVNSNESDRIIYVPCIGINNSAWLQSDKPVGALTIKGAYFESSAKETGLFKREQLQGIQWLDDKFNRVTLTVQDEETAYANLTIFQPKIKVKPSIKNGEVKFHIKAKYQAIMQEYIEEISYEELVKLAEDIIKKEIMNVYTLGVENKLDLYSLMHPFRMKYPKQWITMTDRGDKFILNENSIESLDVKVSIPSNGKYKRRIQ